MLPIRWLANAKDDLAAILGYIADRNPIAAGELLDDIERAASHLPQNLYLYRHGRVPGTRELVVHPNYIIVYRETLTAIEIVNVLHSRQQYP